MPLEVQRLLDSDLYILSSGEEFKAAVSLWCKSWGQLPGGSLPDNDKLLEALSGSKSWKKVKAMALRGWIKCADGRLYHPVVAENAITAWEGREGFRTVNENKNERQRRWRERVKALSAQLRAAGITPPSNASLSELEQLVASHADKSPASLASTEASTVDDQKTASKGQLKSKRQLRVVNQEDMDTSAGKLPTCPVSELITLYHEILPNLPAVRLETESRKRALRKAWIWVLTSKKTDGTRRASTAEEALAWFRTFFTRVTENDFLMGRTPRSAEHANWKPDLDWLIGERGRVHVIEKTEESRAYSAADWTGHAV